MPDDRPIHKCSVKGCPVIGRWEAGGRCPLHRADEPRIPTWIEAQETTDAQTH